MVPLLPPVEMVLTRSMEKEVDPVGVPKVRADPFCTWRVAPLGAEDAPRTAKARGPTPERHGAKLVGSSPVVGHESQAPDDSAGGPALQPGAVGLPRSQQWELVELLD